jgi:hypothetical protein
MITKHRHIASLEQAEEVVRKVTGTKEPKETMVPSCLQGCWGD